MISNSSFPAADVTCPRRFQADDRANLLDRAVTAPLSLYRTNYYFSIFRDTMIEKSEVKPSTEVTTDLAAVYREHQQTVSKMVWTAMSKYRDTLKQEDHDDIEQAVWETLAGGALAGFRGECKLTTYLYRVVFSRTADHLETHLKHQCEEPDEAIMPRNPAESALEAVIDSDLLGAAREVFESLTGTQQLVYVLIGIRGINQEEAALKMGLAQSTVSEHWSGIRRRVEQELSRRYPHHQFDIEEIICRTGY